jgi:hypothetical protein
MRFKAIFIILVYAVIAGCSGITVSQDYDQQTDFASLKTYAGKKALKLPMMIWLS